MTLYEKSINKDMKIKKKKASKIKEKSPRKPLKKKNSWVSPKQDIIQQPSLSKRHSAIDLRKIFDEAQNTNLKKNSDGVKNLIETSRIPPSKKLNEIAYVPTKLRIPLSKMFRNQDGNPSFTNRLEFEDYQSMRHTDPDLPNLQKSGSNVKLNTMSNFIRSQNSMLPKMSSTKVGMTFSRANK